MRLCRFIFKLQSEDLALAASKYLRVLIPSLWTLSLSICLQNWLHAQSKTRAIAVITFIVAILHHMWCYLYIHLLHFGYLGAAMAVTTSKFSELSMLLLYICYFSVHKETEFEFSWECLQGWGNFLLLGTYLSSSDALIFFLFLQLRTWHFLSRNFCCHNHASSDARQTAYTNHRISLRAI